MNNNFFKGARIIWDSGFGYEIGYFISNGALENTYLVELKTGIITTPVCHLQHEIFEYSEELVEKLAKKYGYEKIFSNIF